MKSHFNEVYFLCRNHVWLCLWWDRDFHASHTRSGILHYTILHHTILHHTALYHTTLSYTSSLHSNFVLISFKLRSCVSSYTNIYIYLGYFNWCQTYRSAQKWCLPLGPSGWEDTGTLHTLFSLRFFCVCLFIKYSIFFSYFLYLYLYFYVCGLTLTCVLFYTTLYYATLHYTTLYYTILYYIILYYTILHYTILYYTTLYYTILYYTILYYTILHYTTLHYTTLYYIILYYTYRLLVSTNWSMASLSLNVCTPLVNSRV
jgi:hypothetical protein